MEHEHHSSHSNHSHEEHGHGDSGEEAVIIKKMAPHEAVAASLNEHSVIAEAVAQGTHPLESQPCYSHKFASNPRFTTNKGMVRITGRNFDLVQVVQKH